MEPKGVEIPSHPPDPPAEAAASTVVSFPEGNKEVSDRQRAKNAVAEGAGFIKSKHDGGFFDAGDKVDAKKDAEKVLGQVEENNLDSDGLKAFFNSMSAIGGETAEVRKTAAKNMRVKVGDRMLTLDEWRAELEAAQKPADGIVVDPQKVKELEDGVFAYSFPKTTEENPESASIAREKSHEDIIIADQLSKLEEKIQKMLKKGDQPRLEDQQRIIALRMAANPEALPLIKSVALQHLRESGVLGLDGAIQSVNEKWSTAKGPASEHLKKQGLSDGDINTFFDAIETGKLETMIKEGRFPKAEGLSELLFGKDMSEDALKELLAVEKKKGIKDSLLLALILAAIGPYAFMEQTVSMKPSS